MTLNESFARSIVDNDKYSAESLYYPYAKSRNVVYMLIVSYSAWFAFDFLISLHSGEFVSNLEKS